MNRPSRIQVSMLLALCTVPVGLAAWLLRPRVEVPHRSVDLPGMTERLRQVRAASQRVESNHSEGSSSAHVAPPPTPSQQELSEEWLGLREEVDVALFRRVPLPRDGASKRAVGTYRQRVRERRHYLAVLEIELVDAIENEPDGYARLDAEVRLAELYLAQADVLDQTWIPDNWSDARTRRRLDKLEFRAAVARDKAHLVKGIAEAEALGLHGLPADDALSYRLRDLVGDGSTHGG